MSDAASSGQGQELTGKFSVGASRNASGIYVILENGDNISAAEMNLPPKDVAAFLGTARMVGPALDTEKIIEGLKRGGIDTSSISDNPVFLAQSAVQEAVRIGHNQSMTTAVNAYNTLAAEYDMQPVAHYDSIEDIVKENDRLIGNAVDVDMMISPLQTLAGHSPQVGSEDFQKKVADLDSARVLLEENLGFVQATVHVLSEHGAENNANQNFDWSKFERNESTPDPAPSSDLTH